MSKETILMTIARYQQQGGHNNVINNLCRGLNQIGFRVIIGAFSYDNSPPEGIEFIKLKKAMNWGEEFRNMKVDLIHNHQTKLNYYSLKTKIPFIFHYHGVMGKIQEMNLKISLWLCQNKIRKIISVAQSALNDIPKGIREKIPTEVIYNGVDTDFFNINSECPYKKGEPQLLFVGNLASYKNVEFIVNSMNIIKEKFPNINLQIIGEGSEFYNIKKVIKTKKLENFVTLLGKISSLDEIRKRYNSSDLYVSASTLEACPLPPLEAMACGKPILLSEIPAHQELVEKSNGGLIFSLKNKNDLQRKIVDIFEKRERFSYSSRKFCENNNWSQVCNRISKIYEEILSQ